LLLTLSLTSTAKCLVAHLHREANASESRDEVDEMAAAVTDSPSSSTAPPLPPSPPRQNYNLISVVPTLRQTPWQLDLVPDSEHGVPFQHNWPCPALATEERNAQAIPLSEPASSCKDNGASSLPPSTTLANEVKSTTKKRTAVRVGVCVLVQSSDNEVINFEDGRSALATHNEQTT
jgi:hypothetical protein